MTAAHPTEQDQTVSNTLADAQRRLAPIGAQHEARILLQHVLRCDAARLLLSQNEPMREEDEETLGELIERRLSGYPLQYLLGEWGFMGLPVVVREGVLIPRADTETLAEEALKIAKQIGAKTALDLCCGSGCIAVALAKLGGLAVTAADLSDDALALTAQNARQNGVAGTVTIVKSDLFADLSGTFDLIVSNPPYIPTSEIDSLMREVRDYEPHMALDGGADGLDFYRIIAAKATAYLQDGGVLLVECGAGQAGDVAELFTRLGFIHIERIRDMAGIERVVRAERSCGGTARNAG